MLIWQDIATSAFANSIAFKTFFLVGPLGLGNSDIGTIKEYYLKSTTMANGFTHVTEKL